MKHTFLTIFFFSSLANIACNDTEKDDGETDPNDVDDDSDGYTENSGDCDDGDASLNLNDSDGDGYTTCDGDCNDENSDVHPFASEYCDSIDHNCDGDQHESAVDPMRWYADYDDDGYGGSTNSYIDACEDPSGFTTYVRNSDDCNDFDESINPNAVEIECDDIDQDCDGERYFTGSSFRIEVESAEFPVYSDVDSSEENWDAFGSHPDGYVRITWSNGEVDRTSTYWDSYMPVWYESFSGIVSTNEELEIKLYDDDSPPGGSQSSNNNGIGWTIPQSTLQRKANCGMYLLDGTPNYPSGMNILISVEGIE